MVGVFYVFVDKVVEFVIVLNSFVGLDFFVMIRCECFLVEYFLG